MRKIKLGTVILDYFIAVVFILCFVRIDYLYEGMKMSGFLTALSLGAFVLAALLVTVSLIRKKSITVDIIWLIVFAGSLFLITLILRGNIYQFFATNSGVLGLCLLAYYYISNDKLNVFLDAFIVLEALVYINLLTTFLFPKGMYSTSLYTANWLLGYKNPQIRFILPVLGVSFIRGLEKRDRIGLSSLVLFACAALTMLKVNSTTGILAVAFFGILSLVFLFFFSKRPRWFNLRNICIVFLALNIGLLFLNIQTNFDVLFESLGKNTTLTGRTEIWKISIIEISRHLIIGHGFLTGNDYVEIYNLLAAAHPHNYLLYILMQGGIVYLAIIAGAFLYSGSTLRKKPVSSGTVVLIVIASLFFIGLNEALTGNNFLYMFVILGMNADKFKAGETPKRLFKHRRIKITLR